MAIVLYKIDASPPVRAVKMLIELLGLQVEQRDVNLLEGEHLKAELLKKNPLHTVPFMEVDGILLHDSHAILMYLTDAYAKDDSLYPKNLKQRALVNQKLMFNNSILFIRLRNITYNALFEGEKDVEKKKLDAIEEAYGFLETFLSKSKFLALDSMTIADIAAYATVSGLVFLLPLNTQKYPKTEAWINDMKRQPFVQKANEPGNNSFHQLVMENINL